MRKFGKRMAAAAVAVCVAAGAQVGNAAAGTIYGGVQTKTVST